MTNLETHRQFYLAAAGIRMWYAKRPLPGAAPSPEYQFEEMELASEPHPQVAVSPRLEGNVRTRQPRPRTVDLKALMAPVGVVSPRLPHDPEPEPTDKIDAKQSEVAEVEAPAKTASGDLVERFRIECNLGIWSTNHYLLLSQWSDEASERLQDALACNLIKVLDQAPSESRQVLHWPVFRNPQIPGNSLADFKNVLADLVSSYPERSVIFLGVLSEKTEEDRQHCLGSVLPRVGVDFPHSLAELSMTPGYKRDLWAALKSRYLVRA